ncbi:MAG: DUF3108 domain-containing protein [Bacteroidetes bacterium]|nr:DUF3108 domain-containing protein [Bacteroidota bacterium]
MNRLFLAILLVVSSWQSLSAQSYRKIPNNYFNRGEKLNFKVAYHSLLTGNLTAGSATLELTHENKQIGGRDTYHAIGYGKTTGLIEMFYHIEERFESFFDEEALIPWYFSRNTIENKYQKNDMVTFRHKEKLAVSPKKTTTIPEYVQDIISAFYYARCLDLTSAKPGRDFPVPFFLDDSVYHSKVRYMGKETVKIKLGKFDCLKIKPMVATGYVFDDPYPVSVWVTDDQNRIPVLIECELSVGSARAELVSFSGLANPLMFQPK